MPCLSTVSKSATRWLIGVAATSAAILAPVAADPQCDAPPVTPQLRLEFDDGTILDGMPGESAVILQSRYGPITAPLGRIRRFNWITPDQPQLVIGTINGHHTEFIRELPPPLASRFRRITRAAHTLAAVVDRHRSDPWLYPIAGEGELPRILVEDGKIWIPVLGAWRSVWHDVVYYYDQNHDPIKPDRPAHPPHTATNVDYYVAPLDDVRDLVADLVSQREPAPRITLELDDNSRIHGTPDSGDILVRTPYGGLAVPLSRVAQVVFTLRQAGGESWSEAAIEVRTGEKFHGIPQFDHLLIHTDFGDLTVPSQRLRKLAIPTDGVAVNQGK